MRIGIFGAGAIGGLLAARLAQAGAEVTVVARGPHLAAMQAHGLRLISGGETITTHPRCAADAEAAGEQDFVVVTLKAHALPGAAPAIARMLGRAGTLVTGVNGIPYWYFYGLDGPLRDRTLESVDPGGVLWRTLPPAQALGCVVYPAAEVVAPGVVEHTYSDRFTLGEPDGSRSARAETFAQALQSRRIQGADPPAHPRRDLGEAVGQHGVQPALRTDRRHARSDHRPAGPARRGAGDDGGGAAGRRGARRALPDRRRQAHRGRGRGGRASARRCCRIWSAAGRWRSTRCSAPWWSLRTSRTLQYPLANLCWHCCGSAGVSPAATPADPCRAAQWRRACKASCAFSQCCR